MLKTQINTFKTQMNALKKHLNKRVVITGLSIVAVGVVLFIGGQLGSNQSRGNISESFLPKNDVKKAGKYAAQNSEKAKFFAAKKA